ncbi:MAG TPA: alpha/beta hydrolase [Vicinamibacteria bacterium]
MNSAKRSCAAWLILLAIGITAHAHAQGADATGAVLPVNGIELYYEASGQGAPLVLLHGFNASGALWASVVPELAKTYHVVVPDLRGHGRSTNPTKQFTHRQSALDVFALLDSLGIRQFKAMGISTGGMTLIHMATQQPSRIEAMVLIGATTFFPEQARVIMRGATLESMTTAQWEQRRLIHRRGDEQIRELQLQFHNFKDSYDDMNFTQPYLSTIVARTLIVHGDRDRFFPVEIPLEMYRGIPNASLWIIPQGGHVPVFDPAVPFVPTALKFLAGK